VATIPPKATRNPTNAPTVIPAAAVVNPPPVQPPQTQEISPPPIMPPELALNSVVTEGTKNVNDLTKQAKNDLKNGTTATANDLTKTAPNDIQNKVDLLQAQIERDKKGAAQTIPDLHPAVGPIAIVLGPTAGAVQAPEISAPVAALPPALSPAAKSAAPGTVSDPAPVAPPPAPTDPLVAIPMPPANPPGKIELPQPPPPAPTTTPNPPNPAALATNPPQAVTPVAGPPAAVTPPAVVPIAKNNSVNDPAPAPPGNSNSIAAAPIVSTVPNSAPPLGTPPPATSPVIPVRSQAAAPMPKVTSYDVENHEVQPGDNSMADVSKRLYGSDKYTNALLQYNRQHPFAAQDLKSDPPVLRPGTKIYSPPAYVLESPEFAGPAAQASSSPAAVRAGTPVPLSSAPGNPSAVAAPPPGTKVAVGGPDGSGNYRVRDGGEHIFDIARNVYGTGDRWAEIYRLNPGLRPEFPIPAGTVVKLPAASNAQ
jgi:hypothetical protein